MLGLSATVVAEAAGLSRVILYRIEKGNPAVTMADYPQLKQLAWHVHGVDELTPAEALGIYERNWRHIDTPAHYPGAASPQPFAAA